MRHDECLQEQAALTDIQLCKNNTPSDLANSIGYILETGAKSIMVLACDNDGWNPDSIDAILQACPVPIFGSIFPALLHNGKLLENGTLIIGFQDTGSVSIIKNLSGNQYDLDNNLENNFIVNNDCTSLWMIVDALATQNEYFIESLYDIVGSAINIIGFGGGSLEFVQKPCLFTNEGMLSDAGLLIQMPFPIHKAVQHGWKVLDGPFLVTGSKDTTLETLNFRPALEVYSECIKANVNLDIDAQNFFDIAKTYPLGIKQLDDEILVRDPIMTKEQGLVCVGQIPENSMVYILQGEAEELIKAAHSAAAEAETKFSTTCGNEYPSAFIVSCISRLLFLGADYHQEISAIQSGLDKHKHAFGALTLGEITNMEKGPIILMNKTVIVGVFS